MSISSPPPSPPPTGFGLSSLGGGGLQVTGLASGLNTNAIITAEMAIYQQPVTHLQNQQKGITALNTQLTSIQSQLQTLSSDALAVGDPTLFINQQSVSSSDTTRVSAASSGSGSGVGGYQVSVTQLANSARRTFNYAAPASGSDAVKIDGHSYTINSGESISDFASSINSDANATVYAATIGSGQLVFSNRQTGDTGPNYITVTDTGTSLQEVTANAKQGQNALFSVDGVSGSSASNTVTNGIAGVTLTLTGVTTTSGPVTVNVGAPAPSNANIETAVNAFIKQYNSVISTIQAQLAQAPSATDPTQGVLYGDPGLQGLLSSMRSAMYAPGSGLPAGLATMVDVGVSTGNAAPGGVSTASSLAGNLQLTASTLESALASNPSGVKSVLADWSQSFVNLADNEANPGGSIDARVQGDTSQLSTLNNQISAMQSALTDKQNMLVQEFAQLEAALSTNQSTSSWLTQQLAAIPVA